MSDRPSPGLLECRPHRTLEQPGDTALALNRPRPEHRQHGYDSRVTNPRVTGSRFSRRSLASRR